eukprot:4445137-Prorocentrum_lima.AAC.1
MATARMPRRTFTGIAVDVANATAKASTQQIACLSSFPRKKALPNTRRWEPSSGRLLLLLLHGLLRL